jgi:hypothetical protein
LRRLRSVFRLLFDGDPIPRSDTTQ